MKTIISDVVSLIHSQEPFALATILTHAGSTPRVSGTKMAIRKDGTISGTIGGGGVEAQTIEKAKQLIGLNRSALVQFNLDRQALTDMDMVCGGSLLVLIETVGPSYYPVLKKMAGFLETGDTCILITELIPDSDRHVITRPALLHQDAGVTGDDFFSSVLSKTRIQDLFSSHVPAILEENGRHIVCEPVLTDGKVILFGAGHVSQRVAELTAFIGYPTCVLDDRAAFANRSNFPGAREIHVLPSFERAFDAVSVDAASAIVILTRGHIHDQTVLAQALETPAHYIGMIGSRRKRDIIFGNLVRQGISRKRLSTVHSPVGLDIQAETPQEIAVSIVSELIQERNRLRTHPAS